MEATDFLEQNVLEAIFSQDTLEFQSGVYAALFTTAPTDVGTDGVEVAAASYSRVVIAPMSPSAGSVTNVVAIVFPSAQESWGTVVAFGIYDAPTGGNLLLYEAGLSDAVAAGQTVTVAPSDLAVTVN